MAFCISCGARLQDGARFCASCGTPVQPLQGQSVQTNMPMMHATQEQALKCPNCSSVISKLDAICPFCGAPISNRAASSSVQQFSQQLNEIEKDDFNKKSFDFLGIGKVMESGYGSKTFNRKISLITSFPIPNTIDEITEFIFLAATSIDVKWGKNTLQNKMYGSPGSTYYTNIKLAETWINKLTQAYNKAKLSFGSDPKFPQIEQIYLDKMKELKRKV